jgi:hypothetical protein
MLISRVADGDTFGWITMDVWTAPHRRFLGTHRRCRAVLRLQEVQEMMMERGVVSYDTIRTWCMGSEWRDVAINAIIHIWTPRY